MSNNFPNRREIMQWACGTASSAMLLPGVGKSWLGDAGLPPNPFAISLSERSLTHSITTCKIDHLEFARFAKQELEINAVDYASSFFRDQATEKSFLTEMNKRAADERVRHVLLLVEDEGNLMAGDEQERQSSIERHRLWIDAAATLGCRGVRIHLLEESKSAESTERAVKSIKALSNFAAERKILLLVGNEVGAARDPEWLNKLLKQGDPKRVGSFPYFISKWSDQPKTDPYKTVAALLPSAMGVCSSSRQFDENGRETSIDYARMLEIVTKSGYAGYVSLEFLAEAISEPISESESTDSLTSADSQGNEQSDEAANKTNDPPTGQSEDQEKQQEKSEVCARELAGIKSALKLLQNFQNLNSNR